MKYIQLNRSEGDLKEESNGLMGTTLDSLLYETKGF